MGDLKNHGKLYESLETGGAGWGRVGGRGRGASYQRKERRKLQVMSNPKKVELTF